MQGQRRPETRAGKPRRIAAEASAITDAASDKTICILKYNTARARRKGDCVEKDHPAGVLLSLDYERGAADRGEPQ